MTSEQIEVESYSGSRADERPRSLVIGGRRHIVARLLSESIEEPSKVTKERERRHRYHVLTEDGLVLELIRNDDGRWFLSCP